MIDRAFSSRYRWARRGQRQCVFCACSPGQRSVGGAAHRSGIIPSHRAALVSGDRLQTIAECPLDPRLTPCTQRPGDHRAAAPLPDPAAAPTRRHHRPLPHPGPHPRRGSCAPRTWTSGWPRCTSNNSPDTPPNRSRTCCTGTASRSGAPAATPPATAGNTTTHDDPPRTTPSHRFRGSTASGCRRRARTARPRPAAGRCRAPGWRPMRAPAPGGGFPPG